MKFFGFNKKKDVVDLTQYFNKQKISSSNSLRDFSTALSTSDCLYDLHFTMLTFEIFSTIFFIIQIIKV